MSIISDGNTSSGHDETTGSISMHGSPRKLKIKKLLKQWTLKKDVDEHKIQKKERIAMS